MVLKDGQIAWKGEREDYKPELFIQSRLEDFEEKMNELIQTRAAFDEFEQAVKMEDVQIKYGQRTILQHQNWEIKRGEAWALKGPNGAGKSTMISMITADNPQSYSQKLWLFDRRRGTGESIWEIKKRIGFVSPELHLYFKNSHLFINKKYPKMTKRFFNGSIPLFVTNV